MTTVTGTGECTRARQNEKLFKHAQKVLRKSVSRRRRKVVDNATTLSKLASFFTDEGKLRSKEPWNPDVVVDLYNINQAIRIAIAQNEEKS